jgi:hypothetical protein
MAAVKMAPRLLILIALIIVMPMIKIRAGVHRLLAMIAVENEVVPSPK